MVKKMEHNCMKCIVDDFKTSLCEDGYCERFYGKTGDLIDLIPRWIPCSERLPQEEKKTYWVCTDTGYQCECRWTNVNHLWTDLTTDWHWHIMDIPRYTEVVAWMPLPEPYEEGKTNE